MAPLPPPGPGDPANKAAEQMYREMMARNKLTKEAIQRGTQEVQKALEPALLDVSSSDARQLQESYQLLQQYRQTLEQVGRDIGLHLSNPAVPGIGLSMQVMRATSFGTGGAAGTLMRARAVGSIASITGAGITGSATAGTVVVVASVALIAGLVVVSARKAWKDLNHYRDHPWETHPGMEAAYAKQRQLMQEAYETWCGEHARLVGVPAPGRAMMMPPARIPRRAGG